MTYWTVEIPTETPLPSSISEVASLHVHQQKKMLLFRDRFNAFKVAQVLGSRPKPWIRGES